jgi:DNA ligase-1
MKFKVVAEVFEKISSTSSRLQITQDLAHLFKSASPEEVRQICYLSLGVLNPPYKGTQFNIAQKSMTKMVAHIAAVSEQEIIERSRESGDLGSVLQLYQWVQESDLTVKQVYDDLSVIERISGIGSQENKAQHVYKLVGSG